MSAPQSEAFKQAVIDSKKLTAKPSNEELLDIYGLFKVATGEDITTAPSPGMFDLKGKAKKAAWQKVVDEGLTAEQAQERYVEYIEKLKAKHGYDPDKVPETIGSS